MHREWLVAIEDGACPVPASLSRKVRRRRTLRRRQGVALDNTCGCSPSSPAGKQAATKAALICGRVRVSQCEPDAPSDWPTQCRCYQNANRRLPRWWACHAIRREGDQPGKPGWSPCGSESNDACLSPSVHSRWRGDARGPKGTAMRCEPAAAIVFSRRTGVRCPDVRTDRDAVLKGARNYGGRADALLG
jgi:hypothetical protein